MYDKNGNHYFGHVTYDSLGNPKDYNGDYLSYNAPTPRPISQPRKSSSSSNFSWGSSNSNSSWGSSGSSSNNSYSDDVTTGMGVVGGAVIVLPIFAAVTVVGGIYYASKAILDKTRGKEANNNIYAGIITAGILTSAAAGFWGYKAYEQHMVEKYPYMSIQIDNNGRVFSAKGKTKKEASSLAQSLCAPGIFSYCIEKGWIPGGKPACISLGQVRGTNRYYADFFYKGENDALERKKFVLASILSEKVLKGEKPSASSDYMGDVTYFCNSSEMNEQRDTNRKSLEESERSIEESLSFIPSTTKPKPTKPSKPSKPDPEIQTRPSNSAAIAADPSIQPIFDETVTSAAPSESPALRDYFRVTASMLNIREGAGTNNGVEGKLARGSCVSVERGADDVRGFLEIMAQSANGTKIDGYVSTQYLSAIRPAPAACVATFQ